MGYGLFLAQKGEKHRKAKPLKGFAGAGTLEMISDHRGNTIARFTLSGWLMPFMCFTPSRRSPGAGYLRRKRNWSSFAED